jgi:hypothetical protein
VQGFVADDANWWRSWLPGVAPDYRDAVYLARYGQDVLIVFRGTKPLNIEDVASVEDWVNDANAELKPEGPLGPVHRGFHQSLDNLWAGKHGLGSALAAWSRDGKLQDRNVYVVGHSKGGAVADLAALKLYANHLPVKAVFTFAGARAGGDEFYANYQGAQIATTRFENQRDLVPHLPPAQEELQLLSNAKLLKNAIRIKGAYRPVGSLHYIHADGQVETPATPSEEEALGKRRLKEFEKWASERPPEQVFGKLASAHSIDPPDKNETGTELHRYYRAACR